jgi:hypothetical protein
VKEEKGWIERFIAEVKDPGYKARSGQGQCARAAAKHQSIMQCSNILGCLYGAGPHHAC